MIRRLAAACSLAIALAVAAPPARAAEEARAHWTVSTSDAQAQELFDRGLAMLFAFDIGEARVAFEQAIKHDPELAMAYWGAAEADTIDINQPTTPEGERRGADAVARAHQHLAHASAEERALIDAIGYRYAKGTLKEKYTRYATAMSAYTKTRRDEPNALVVAAFALYVAEEALLDGKDALTPKAREMLADADRALELEPTNLGAHHLRIHLLENAAHARDAVPDAAALASYTYPLGESHLPHMAGHIWARVGDYDRLIDDNERAIANDRAWFAQGDGPGQRAMRVYHDHNVDFVLYGLTTIGRVDDALAAAKDEDGFMRARLALRLHDAGAVRALSAAAGPFARAIAAARAGDVARAKSERATFDTSDDLHRALVDAMLARHAGNAAECAAAYARAYDASTSSLPGDPKDFWATPIGEGYGAALLAAGKPGAAELVFAAELKRFPNDPHLEWGLAEALKAQGKDDAVPRAAYAQHWKGARDLTQADLG